VSNFLDKEYPFFLSAFWEFWASPQQRQGGLAFSFTWLEGRRMFSYLKCLLGKPAHSGCRPHQRRPKRARTQLLVECLEERTVPTVMINFNPVFGPETQAQSNGAHLDSPPVYLIFWGSYWSTNQAQAATVQNAAGKVLASSYLSYLMQYGSDGQATLGDPNHIYWDNSDPSWGNFGEGDITTVIDAQFDAGYLTKSTNAIYVVVTPPGATSSTVGAGGFNHNDDVPSLWVGTSPDASNNPKLDPFTRTLSHEVAECMSDLGGGGFEVNAGANFPLTPPNDNGQGQIGDYEGNSYGFRQSNGAVVQPYWSNFDTAWVAPDDNYQTLNLDPVVGWDTLGFHHKYDLTIKGDQLPSLDDTLTISSSAGGVDILLNGERTHFDASWNNIQSITVNLGTGNDTINLDNTTNVPININLGDGTDTVNITPTTQNLDNLRGGVHINGGSGSDTLNVYDQLSNSTSTYQMTGSALIRGASTTIFYTGISTVNVHGGTGHDTFSVGDTGLALATTVYCGPGGSGSTVNVLGPTGNLKIVASNSSDTVNVSSLQTIHGALTIENAPQAATSIKIDDFNDLTARIGTLDTMVPAGETLPFGVITGMTPASGSIQFQWSGTTAVSIITGHASNTFNVLSTSCPVFFDSAGDNTVDVGGTGPRGLPGSVQGIAGSVLVRNSNGHTQLIVDDAGDAQTHSATINSSSITNLATADIDYVGNQLASLTIFGGSNLNDFFVRSTPTGSPTAAGPAVSLILGSGIDFVDVGDAYNRLDGIQGPLVVSGQGGQHTLSLYDQGSNAHTYTLTSTPTTSTLARSGAAPITYDNAAGYVIVNGSTGVDTYTVQSPKPAIQVTFHGAGTMNTLVGPNLPNTTWQITGPDTGQLGVVYFDGMQNLVGGGSSNTFHFSTLGSISGSINGGGSGQTNTLDYSATSTTVAVDLGQQSASRIRAGAANGFSEINWLVGSSALDNSLGGANTTNLWQITGANAGNVNTTFHFSSIGNLLGGTGVDTFRFTAAGSISGNIDGGGGGDWLDYSPRSTAVTVNLTTGTATSVANGAAGGVSRIQHVIGSGGSNTLTGNALGNILIGGAGTNVIHGGSGRSLLIGGRGTSTITGGIGDDILIAGTTVYDANEAALMSILREWQRPDKNFLERIADLHNGGGLNDNNKLIWGATVLDNDVAGAHLTGGGGSDWVLNGSDDTTH
jgi:hypothetical protein